MSTMDTYRQNYPCIRLEDGTEISFPILAVNDTVCPIEIDCTQPEPDMLAPIMNDPTIIHMLEEGIPQALINLGNGRILLQRVRMIQETGRQVLLCYPVVQRDETSGHW